MQRKNAATLVVESNAEVIMVLNEKKEKKRGRKNLLWIAENFAIDTSTRRKKANIGACTNSAKVTSKVCSIIMTTVLIWVTKYCLSTNAKVFS